MGKCETKILAIHFDFSDEQLTNVKVFVEAIGDCPHTVQGWHEKAFPARRSALEILQNEIAKGDYLLW